MKFATYEDFQKLAANDRYYKQSRWKLYSQVQSLIAEESPASILELGSYRFPLVIGGDTMDRTDKFNPTIAHDAKMTPWPIEDHTYEMFVSLQVWEHLQGFQQQAFREVKRIADSAILSFPYKWNCEKTDPTHHGITKEIIAEWTIWTPPDQVIVIPSSNNYRRIIYKFDFTRERSHRDVVLYKKSLRQKSLSEPVPTLRRSIEECRYRSDVSQLNSEETARCQFVESVFEEYHHSIEYSVKQDACQTCITEHEPTSNNFNTVVSSLIYSEVDRIRNRDQNPEKLSKLHRQAENGLRMVFRKTEHQAKTDLDQQPPSKFGNSQKLIDRLPLQCEAKPVKNWMVGVTTSPRKVSTIDQTLDSIVRAGWSSPWLFMDSTVEVAQRHQHLPVTFREAVTGAWSNFYLALAELVHRNPQADAYMMLQDDVVLTNSENLRNYLEQVLWPHESVKVISLFCSGAYDKPEEGWHFHQEQWVWGALALIFSNQSAWEFLADPQVIAHRKSQRFDGTRLVDVNVGEWVQRTGKIIFPVPSLAQHIGTRSTLWKSATTDNNRRAVRFIE